MYHDFLRYRHLFFEDPNPDDQNNDPQGDANKDDQNKTDPKPADEKKYTDADLDRFKVQWKAQWQKKVQKEQAEKDEAARLASMTEQERVEHERNELKKQVAELTAEKTRNGLANEARRMIKEAGADVSEKMLARLIGEDAETTAENVKDYISDFQAAVQATTKAQLAHKAPITGGANTITKEDILKIENWQERQKKINENLNLFK
jgi:hypothetical protein